MNINLATDLHINGCPSVEVCSYSAFRKWIAENTNIVLLGDIFDRANSLKEMLETTERMIDATSTLVEDYVSGNHECNYGGMRLSKVIHEIVYINHSDLISYPERYLAFRAKKPGASTFKRNIISPVIDFARHFHEVRPNEKMFQHMEEIAAKNPEIRHAWFGHGHPSRIIEFQVGRIACKMFPQGFHTVEI